jgi:fatty acid desaturase
MNETSEKKTWNPLTEWKHTDVDWIRVNISREDLKRFTTRSDLKGLAYAMGFLLLIAATGTLAYMAFARGLWLLLALALYVHGSFYAFFGNALHELSHNTVFRSKWLNVAFTSLFGWLYWPYNPHLYRLSHQKYHHRYTLYQGSDGEDVPNYVELEPRLFFDLFLRAVRPKELVQNLGRLVTLKPTSKGWRGRGYHLDWWEQFVLQNASEKERRQVYRMAAASLIGHVLFVALCIVLGVWFLPILVTFAPFYGASFMGFMAGIHQHAACEANHPDFRVSCGDATLDPLTSFLYWRMEYHIEHHMFAAIPCYNLKPFSRFVADQLPPKEPAIPRIRKLHEICKERYGSRQAWRDRHGLYKGY